MDFSNYSDFKKDEDNISLTNNNESNVEVDRLLCNDAQYEILYKKNGTYNIFEDDIILFSPSDSPLLAAPDTLQSISMKWNDNKIPYKIDPNLR